MTVRITMLNQDGDPIETGPDFATVEDAKEWCEARSGGPLEEGEDGRFFSFEYMTKAESDHLTDTGEYPPLRFWVYGVEVDGTARELEDADFREQEQ